MDHDLSAPLDDFKPRELEILSLMADGHSNQEIADQLFITKETVRWYNKQIYSKLGTSRRTEAVALAREMGLLGTLQPERDTAPPARYRRQQLPLTTGPFVGRSDEIAELTQLLDAPDIRLISIIGLGGMGKSRLSLELGHVVASQYKDGAVFIDLTPVRNPDDVASTAVTTLDLSPGNQQQTEEILFNYCRNKQLLLIFDNFEHVLPAADLLARILKNAQQAKIIVTSRERLNLRIETSYYLSPLLESAEALFRELVAMMHPHVTVTASEQDAVARIVGLVGGLPLGLLLAATWADTLAMHEIADEIAQNLDFLSTELADMPERQQSIHAAIAPTWQRLNPAEQQAFMWASMFRGGFGRKLFQQVTGASSRVLQTLLNRSLIAPGYERRYDMHPLLRQFAREQLAHNPDMETTAHHAHLKAFLAYAQSRNAVMLKGQYLASLVALELELDNFRAALDRAFNGKSDAVIGAKLAIELCYFWDTRSHLVEGNAYITAALQRSLPETIQAPLLCWQGRLQHRLGNVKDALQCLNHAIELAQDIDDQLTLARSYNYRSQYAETIDDSFGWVEKALEISEALQDKQLMAMSHNMIANMLSTRRDNKHALQHYRQAEQLYREVGELRGISMVVYNIGLLYHIEQNHAQFHHYVQESLMLKRQIGDRAGIARRFAALSIKSLLDEDWEQAKRYAEESLAICEETGDRERWSYCVEVQATIYFAMADFEQARLILEEAIILIEQQAATERRPTMHNLLSLIYLQLNQLPKAHHHVHQQLKAATHNAMAYVRWLSLVGYVQYLWATGEHEISVQISAVLYRLRALGSAIDHRYIFTPYIYRIEQQIGKEAWEHAQTETASHTLEDVFHDVIETL